MTSGHNTIGGTTAGARNLISAGIGLRFSGPQVVGNLVEGSYIGTDVTGAKALGYDGIDLQNRQRH